MEHTGAPSSPPETTAKNPLPTGSVSPDPVVDWTGVQVAWGDGRLFRPFSPNPV